MRHRPRNRRPAQLAIEIELIHVARAMHDMMHGIEVANIRLGRIEKTRGIRPRTVLRPCPVPVLPSFCPSACGQSVRPVGPASQAHITGRLQTDGTSEARVLFCVAEVTGTLTRLRDWRLTSTATPSLHAVTPTTKQMGHPAVRARGTARAGSKRVPRPGTRALPGTRGTDGGGAWMLIAWEISIHASGAQEHTNST